MTCEITAEQKEPGILDFELKYAGVVVSSSRACEECLQTGFRNEVVRGVRDELRGNLAPGLCALISDIVEAAESAVTDESIFNLCNKAAKGEK